jgi:hypothetical protein
MERGHLQEPGMGGNIKCMFKKTRGGLGLMWFRIGRSGGLLCTRQ